MKQIVISEVFSSAWELTKRHWPIALACVVISYVITQVFSTLLGPSPLEQMNFVQSIQNGNEPDPTAFLQFYASALRGNFIGSVVIMIFTAGVFRLILEITRGKRSDFSLDAWKMPVSVYVNFLITHLIISFICGFGFLCCILPGIYLHARLQFALYYIVERQASIGEAISASWNRTSDNGLSLSLVFVCEMLCMFAGFLCCCIGVLVSSIINYFVDSTCYVLLFNEEASEPSAVVIEETSSVASGDNYNKSER